MIFDPQSMRPRDVYKLITGTIVPRPIAWVSTLGPEGRANLAPFSYFNGVASRPATVSVSFAHPGRSAVESGAYPTGMKDTLANIRRSEELVINLVPVELEEKMNQSAATYPAEVDEFEALGLEKAPSTVVSPPGVAGSKVRFECSLDRQIQVGDGTGSSTLILATVLRVHVTEGIINEEFYTDVRALDPVGRLAGQRYASLGEIREYDRKEIGRLGAESY